MGLKGFNVLVRHNRSKRYPHFEMSEGNNVGVCDLCEILKLEPSFPDNRGTEEGQSTEATRRQKLDMGHVNGCDEGKKMHSSNAEIQNSLRQEILLLQKRLQDQLSCRCALENALGYRASSREIITDETTIPKPVVELIKEIAILELEVGHLEQYLLSLYRKAFDPQISSLSPLEKDVVKPSALATPRRRRLDFSGTDITLARDTSFAEAETPTLSDSMKEGNDAPEKKVLESCVEYSHSSLSQRSALPNGISPPEEASGIAPCVCHSKPLSMMAENEKSASTNVISLAEHLGTSISDHIPETPNKLSEEMVKCMSNIYCKLANPPLPNHGLSSPTSSLSSTSAFSPKDQYDSWSPGFRKDSSFDVPLDNPFHVEGLKDFSGPYSRMVEVHRIFRDSQKMGDIEYLLQNFRSLISRLEDTDPKKMTHEEKLAFWINVHNALVMHAFLAYGIPQNNMKRMFLLLKTAYNVGGQVLSADVIQNSILGCRIPRPAQWLRLLLSSKTKFKAGDERQTYAIERPEPLLYFTLSSGSYSDPALRAYTPKRIFQEMEAAKEDYIRATFGFRKHNKILLPKIVESFAKDSGLCTADITEMIEQTLPNSSLRKSIKKSELGKSRKHIEWIPHNFAFKYLLSKELVK